ncbi:antibiotic biosynthesis monooxygenase family protein [Stygiobacter electus]|uniref:Antibiotic biosynthesis monooxygenase n=1 Tax=Stygiobacter electus TaxID=3032292 RepID=A0AAE3P563_9BACT|nr:hypothetical protein [Stygiobacter electus]MDF1613285.1 hypothetical protein [Stygiobacter electus]
MIVRIWHGWTKSENAATYEKLLRTEIFTGILKREIAGFKGIQLLKRIGEDEQEFITLMWFESIQAIKEFAGEDYTRAVVPDKARELLKRFDPHSQHYEIKETKAPCCTNEKP